MVAREVGWFVDCFRLTNSEGVKSMIFFRIASILFLIVMGGLSLTLRGVENNVANNPELKKDERFKGFVERSKFFMLSGFFIGFFLMGFSLYSFVNVLYTNIFMDNIIMLFIGAFVLLFANNMRRFVSNISKIPDE